MFLGLGYISGILIKGNLYTLKYSRSVGLFYYDEFETYLKWYLQNNANLISIIKSGAFPEDVYITINPITTNLTSSYIIDVINKGIEQFRNKYTPAAAISTLSFVDIIEGSGTTVMQKEQISAGLPAWSKDLAIIAGVIILGAVAITALVKKI